MSMEIVLYDHTGSICSQMARLALVEKGVPFRRHDIDIMERNEQFEPWYVELNPRAVVPTLRVGDEIVTDTIRIVNRVQSMPGPDLAGDDSTQDWLRAIMDLHYGVLLYRNRLAPDGTARQILAREKFLVKLRQERPDFQELIQKRLEGNRRLQKLLTDGEAIRSYVDTARGLVDRMATALSQTRFLAGASYSLADCFATAALARFTIHGFAPWWDDSPVASYYVRMKSRPSFARAQVVDTGNEWEL